MPKPKKKRKMMGKGYLTERVDKVGSAVLKQLAFTEKTFKDIGNAFNLEYGIVSRLNTLYGIRSAERIKQIQMREIACKLVLHAESKRKKVFHFKPGKKKALIRTHVGGLLKLAKWSWAESASIRQAFAGDFNLFFGKLKADVSKNLDYYSPDATGFEGKTASPFTWMMRGAKMFCWRMYDRSSRQKEKTMPLEKGLPIAQTDKVKPTRKVRLEPTTPKLEWIPVSAKALLTKLGLGPKRVARAGFFGVRRQIIKLVEAKATGLTEMQKKVVKLRLKGKQLRDIALLLKKDYQNVALIETSAAKKIRWQIRKKKLKAKKQ